MTSLNISLPRSMRLYIQARVRKGPYSTPSEFIRTLIREDEKRHSVHTRLAGLLDATIRDESNLTETDWASLERLFQGHFGTAASPKTRSSQRRGRSTRPMK